MKFDRFLIAPLNSGLEKNQRPWLISDDAFAELRNAYNFRGRIRKRFGSRLLQGSAAVAPEVAQLESRLRLQMSGEDTGFSTDGVGAFGPAVIIAPPFVIGQKFLVTDGVSSEILTIPALGAAVVLSTTGPSTTHTLDTTTGTLTLVGSIANASIFFFDMISGSSGVGQTDGAGIALGVLPNPLPVKIGQMFSIGSEIYTVNALGTPVTLLSTGSGSFSLNTTTGEFLVVNAPINSPVYFYPAEPVMGLLTYERNNINDEILYAFDTQFAYTYANGWNRLGTAVWTGNNADFFWGTNYSGANSYDNILFVTNFNIPDGIQYWDGTTWATLVPVIDGAGNTVNTCRIILPFKDRLILLNTNEKIGGTDREFPQRCRFSQNGDPTAAASAWLETTPGRGGYVDAPTKEQIISAEFLKDRLIVFFERSTWELVYTGNQVLPFSWQKINTELGAESTFSAVPFDKVVLGIGNVGIHACSGTNVERIDNKIPDEVFALHNENNGVQRVYGIRDYKVEMVYWTFPNLDENRVFPNRVLIYNYKTGSWALNDDSITCFGYFQNPNDITWQSTNLTWEQYEATWNSGTQQALFRQVIAGNQEGWTFIIDPDVPRNAASLQITDVSIAANIVTLTIIDHNLTVGEYIYLNFLSGITGLDDTIQQVFQTPTTDTITIDLNGVSGTYAGGGTVQRVSNYDIRTKEFNFYTKMGESTYIERIGFYVDRNVGEVMVDLYASSASNTSLITNGSASGALIGSSVLNFKPFTLISFEQYQERFWHAVYFQGEGSTVQMRLYMSDTQMRDKSIAESDFQLHAMTIYAGKTNNYF